MWINRIACGLSLPCADQLDSVRIPGRVCGYFESFVDYCHLVRILRALCGFLEVCADYFAGKFALLNYCHQQIVGISTIIFSECLVFVDFHPHDFQIIRTRF